MESNSDRVSRDSSTAHGNPSRVEPRNLDFTSIYEIIVRNWKTIAVVVVVSAIVGVVISMPMIMTPKFKSTAIVYPANIEPYSDESETEQLLQYFEAGSVRDSIIEKFDLYSHYDIKPDAKSARFYLLQEFSDNFVTSKTSYESILLEVTDEDPEMAKAMADEVLRQVNLKYNDVVNSKARLQAESYYNQMTYQAAVLDSLENIISELSTENRVLEYGSQTRELVKGYINALSTNRSQDLETLETWLDDTRQKGSVLRMLQNLSYMGTQQYSEVNRSYLYYREKAYSNLSYMDIVLEPEVADKKYWPVRWLIVAVCMVTGFLAALIAVGFLRR